MDDNVPKILKDPLADLIAFDGVAFIPQPGEGGIGLLGDGVKLAPTGPGGDHEKVVYGRDRTHIQHQNISPLVLVRNASRNAGPFQCRGKDGLFPFCGRLPIRFVCNRQTNLPMILAVQSGSIGISLVVEVI